MKACLMVNVDARKASTNIAVLNPNAPSSGHKLKTWLESNSSELLNIYGVLTHLIEG